MPKVALLIGVSRYGTGLDLLPQAQKNVEVMERVLKQPRFQFESVQCLCDRPLQVMQETIELFFKQRDSNDQIVFLFCGYTLQDAESKFYFATPGTALDEQGAIVKAQFLPAIAVQDAMDNSPARQQVCILDSYRQQSLNEPIAEAAASPLAAHLAGKGRVVLAAANVNPSAETAAFDVWTYTRYLAEGIESGAADLADDGVLTAAALHHYAAQKLQVAAPALETQLVGSAEMAQIPLLEVPKDNPQMQYRKVLETAALTTDVAGMPILDGRSLLYDVRDSLGISPQQGAELEVQVLRPTLEYHLRTALYQKHVTESVLSHELHPPQIPQRWKQLQQALYLKDQDVAMMTIAPSLALKQRQQSQYQDRLVQYQQILLRAMQRQSPLQESDRTMLKRLQQTLHLGDDDVKTLEAQIIAQAEQFTATNASKVAVDPSKANAASQPSPAQSLEPNTISPPLPTEAPAASLDDSRAKEAVLHRLFNMNEPDTPTLERTQTPEPISKPIPVQEPLPSLPIAQPNFMDRIRRSASNYQALIIPAILLAAILGLLAAILPSSNRPNWFKFGQQTPADPTAAQQFNVEGLRKAQAGYPKEAIDDYNQAIEKNPNDGAAYINRGVAHHRLGDTDAAIRDYEQALKLDPKSALVHSNLSYAYYDRQNYDKALDEGNQAVALNGNLAQAHINLANARSKKGDYPGALRDYDQALALKPAAAIQAGAYNNRGNVRLALNNARAAIGDYKRAIRLQPDYADARYNLGLAQQALNNRP